MFVESICAFFIFYFYVFLSDGDETLLLTFLEKPLEVLKGNHVSAKSVIFVVGAGVLDAAITKDENFVGKTKAVEAKFGGDDWKCYDVIGHLALGTEESFEGTILRYLIDEGYDAHKVRVVNCIILELVVKTFKFGFAFVLKLDSVNSCLSLKKVDSQSQQLCGSITQRKENFITTV